MPVPETNFSPPFNITRASHIRLTVRDLPRAREFYTEVIGLLVTDEDTGVAYLRGVEETCHHSLVLRATNEAPVCEAIGFRVFRDEDLDAAKAYFDKKGIPARWMEHDFQARTLEVRDHTGVPVEFCASMPTQPRLHDRPHLH